MGFKKYFLYVCYIITYKLQFFDMHCVIESMNHLYIK